MIFYRDRGDLFITKQIPLTTDLDNVYSDLLEIIADSGGDSPESPLINSGKKALMS